MGTVGKIVKPIIDNNRGYEIFVLYIFINYKVLFIFITSVVYALLCFVVAFIVSVHGSVPDFRRGDKGNIRHSWLFLLYQMWIILFIKHS